MKFLESKEIEVKKGDIEITFKPVTPINQSTLLGYQAELDKAIRADDVALNIQVQMKTVSYALNEMVNALVVAGEEYDPKKVASCANAADQETFETLKAIYDITTGLLVEGYTKKKLSSQQKPISKGKAAKDAQPQIVE